MVRCKLWLWPCLLPLLFFFLGGHGAVQYNSVRLVWTSDVMGRIMAVNEYGKDCSPEDVLDSLPVDGPSEDSRGQPCFGGVWSHRAYFAHVKNQVRQLQRLQQPSEGSIGAGNDSFIPPRLGGVAILETGGYFFGSIFWNQFHGNASMDFLQFTAQGYDAMSLATSDIYGVGPGRLQALLGGATSDLPSGSPLGMVTNLHPSDGMFSDLFSLLVEKKMLAFNGTPDAIPCDHLPTPGAFRLGLISVLPVETIDAAGPKGKDLDLEVPMDSILRAQAEWELLPLALQPNAIVLVSGLEMSINLELARRMLAVRLIISTHREPWQPQEGGESSSLLIPVLNLIGQPCYVATLPGSNLGRVIGDVQLGFDTDTGFLSDVNGVQVELSPSSGFLDPNSTQESWAKAVWWYKRSKEEAATEVIGELVEPGLDGEEDICRTSECTSGNFVADAIRYRLLLDSPSNDGDTNSSNTYQWLPQVALLNAGSIRQSLEPGNLTLDGLRQMLPYDDTLVMVELEGKYLRAAVEHGLSRSWQSHMTGNGRFLHVSGLQFEWIPLSSELERTGQSLERITDMWVDVSFLQDSAAGQWQPLQDESLYRVGMSEYLYGGGDGFTWFAEYGTLRERSTEPLYLVAADYLETQSPYSGMLDGRIRRSDEIQHVLLGGIFAFPDSMDNRSNVTVPDANNGSARRLSIAEAEEAAVIAQYSTKFSDHGFFTAFDSLIDLDLQIEHNPHCDPNSTQDAMERLLYVPAASVLGPSCALKATQASIDLAEVPQLLYTPRSTASESTQAVLASAPGFAIEMVPGPSRVSLALLQLLLEMDWKHVALVSVDSDPETTRLAEAFRKESEVHRQDPQLLADIRLSFPESFTPLLPVENTSLHSFNQSGPTVSKNQSQADSEEKEPQDTEGMEELEEHLREALTSLASSNAKVVVFLSPWHEALAVFEMARRMIAEAEKAVEGVMPTASTDDGGNSNQGRFNRVYPPSKDMSPGEPNAIDQTAMAASVHAKAGALKNLAWVGNEDWLKQSPLLSSFPFIRGAMGVVPFLPASNPQARALLKDWQRLDPAIYPDADGDRTTLSKFSYYSFDAVSVLAHAIESMNTKGLDFSDGPSLRKAILETSVDGATGSVEFTAQGKRETIFQTVNLGYGNTKPIAAHSEDAVLQADAVDQSRDRDALRLEEELRQPWLVWQWIGSAELNQFMDWSLPTSGVFWPGRNHSVPPTDGRAILELYEGRGCQGRSRSLDYSTSFCSLPYSTPDSRMSFGDSRTALSYRINSRVGFALFDTGCPSQGSGGRDAVPDFAFDNSNLTGTEYKGSHGVCLSKTDIVDLMAAHERPSNLSEFGWIGVYNEGLEVPSFIVDQTIITVNYGAIVLGYSLASLGILLSCFFLLHQHHHKKDRVVVMNSPHINEVALIGSLLVYVAVYLDPISSIQLGTEGFLRVQLAVRCMFFFAVTIGFGPLFMKTYRIHKIIHTSGPEHLQLSDLKLLSYVFLMILVDTLLLGLWQLFSPAEVVFETVGHMVPISPTQWSQPVVETIAGPNDQLWLGLCLLFKCSQLSFGLYMGCSVRNVAVPVLNDSQWIGLSVYNAVIMCLVLGAGTLVGLQDATAGYILTSLAVTDMAIATLLLLWLPKAWAIYKGESFRYSTASRAVSQVPRMGSQALDVNGNQQLEMAEMGEAMDDGKWEVHDDERDPLDAIFPPALGPSALLHKESFSLHKSDYRSSNFNIKGQNKRNGARIGGLGMGRQYSGQRRGQQQVFEASGIRVGEDHCEVEVSTVDELMSADDFDSVTRNGHYDDDGRLCPQGLSAVSGSYHSRSPSKVESVGVENSNKRRNNSVSVSYMKRGTSGGSTSENNFATPHGSPERPMASQLSQVGDPSVEQGPAAPMPRDGSPSSKKKFFFKTLSNKLWFTKQPSQTSIAVPFSIQVQSPSDKLDESHFAQARRNSQPLHAGLRFQVTGVGLGARRSRFPRDSNHSEDEVSSGPEFDERETSEEVHASSDTGESKSSDGSAKVTMEEAEDASPGAVPSEEAGLQEKTLNLLDISASGSSHGIDAPISRRGSVQEIVELKALLKIASEGEQHVRLLDPSAVERKAPPSGSQFSTPAKGKGELGGLHDTPRPGFESGEEKGRRDQSHSQQAIMRAGVSCTASSSSRNLPSSGGFANKGKGPKKQKERVEQKQVMQISLRKHDLHVMGSIGKGASGEVKKAIHFPSLSVLALKYLSIDERGVRHQMMKEMKAYFKLKSRYIVKFVGAYFDRDSKSIVLASEYMDCGSMDTFVQKHGPLPDPGLRHISLQFVKGVLDMHKRRLVHCDLKPDNILLNHKGELKITDLGLAESLSGGRKLTKPTGTRLFLAPEVMKEKEHGYPRDVWALGVTLVYLSTGKLPFGLKEKSDYWTILDKVMQPSADSDEDCDEEKETHATNVQPEGSETAQDMAASDPSALEKPPEDSSPAGKAGRTAGNELKVEIKATDGGSPQGCAHVQESWSDTKEEDEEEDEEVNPNQTRKRVLSPVGTGLDPGFCDLVEQCLRTNPKKRPNLYQVLEHPYLRPAGIWSELEDAFHLLASRVHTQTNAPGSLLPLPSPLQSSAKGLIGGQPGVCAELCLGQASRGKVIDLILQYAIDPDSSSELYKFKSFRRFRSSSSVHTTRSGESSRAASCGTSLGSSNPWLIKPPSTSSPSTCSTSSSTPSMSNSLSLPIACSPTGVAQEVWPNPLGTSNDKLSTPHATSVDSLSDSQSSHASHRSFNFAPQQRADCPPEASFSAYQSWRAGLGAMLDHGEDDAIVQKVADYYRLGHLDWIALRLGEELGLEPSSATSTLRRIMYLSSKKVLNSGNLLPQVKVSQSPSKRGARNKNHSRGRSRRSSLAATPARNRRGTADGSRSSSTDPLGGSGRNRVGGGSAHPKLSLVTRRRSSSSHIISFDEDDDEREVEQTPALSPHIEADSSSPVHQNQLSEGEEEEEDSESSDSESIMDITSVIEMDRQERERDELARKKAQLQEHNQRRQQQRGYRSTPGSKGASPNTPARRLPWSYFPKTPTESPAITPRRTGTRSITSVLVQNLRPESVSNLPEVDPSFVFPPAQDKREGKAAAPSSGQRDSMKGFVADVLADSATALGDIISFQKIHRRSAEAQEASAEVMPPPGTPKNQNPAAWKPQDVRYQCGDDVSFKGITYCCTKAHQSNPERAPRETSSWWEVDPAQKPCRHRRSGSRSSVTSSQTNSPRFPRVQSFRHKLRIGVSDNLNLTGTAAHRQPKFIRRVPRDMSVAAGLTEEERRESEDGLPVHPDGAAVLSGPSAGFRDHSLVPSRDHSQASSRHASPGQSPKTNVARLNALRQNLSSLALRGSPLPLKKTLKFGTSGMKHSSPNTVRKSESVPKLSLSKIRKSTPSSTRRLQSAFSAANVSKGASTPPLSDGLHSDLSPQVSASSSACNSPSSWNRQRLDAVLSREPSPGWGGVAPDLTSQNRVAEVYNVLAESALPMTPQRSRGDYKANRGLYVQVNNKKGAISPGFLVSTDGGDGADRGRKPRRLRTVSDSVGDMGAPQPSKGAGSSAGSQGAAAAFPSSSSFTISLDPRGVQRQLDVDQT